MTDPLTASDLVVSLYADYYFEYDALRRVTKERVQGGSRTFTFSYAQSAFADDYNHWKTKTVETLPSGAQNLVYSNYAGQTMLHVFKSGSDEWLSAVPACRSHRHSDENTFEVHSLLQFTE